MKWEDERYVRVYIRDTTDLVAFGWEGRALWWEMLRKADRAGVLAGCADFVLLADLVRMPEDVVDRAVARILRRGSVEIRGDDIVIPNFQPAQEAKMSVAQRKREERARKRARAAGVTKSDIKSRSVPGRGPPRDEMSREVAPDETARDRESRNVTPSLAEPSLAEPSLAVPSLAEPASDARARVDSDDDGPGIAVELGSRDPPPPPDQAEDARRLAALYDELGQELREQHGAVRFRSVGIRGPDLATQALRANFDAETLEHCIRMAAVEVQARVALDPGGEVLGEPGGLYRSLWQSGVLGVLAGFPDAEAVRAAVAEKHRRALEKAGRRSRGPPAHERNPAVGMCVPPEDDEDYYARR